MKKKKLFVVIGVSFLIMACSLSSVFPVQEVIPTQVVEAQETETPMILPSLEVSTTPAANSYQVEEPQSGEAAEIEKTTLPTMTPEISFRNLQPDIFRDDYEYDLQNFSPAFLPNFTHPEAGCGWMGAAGQGFNKEGYPQEDIVIVVEGSIAGETIEALGFSGLAPLYGPGGYEVVLSDQAQPGLFWLQLFNVEGEAVSEIVQFEMSGDCEQNLALINFYQTNLDYQLYVPLIQH